MSNKEKPKADLIDSEEAKEFKSRIDEGIVRFVVVSDTHNQEPLMPESLPNGDVLLHCGDMSNVGKTRELEIVNEWFGK